MHSPCVYRGRHAQAELLQLRIVPVCQSFVSRGLLVSLSSLRMANGRPVRDSCSLLRALPPWLWRLRLVNNPVKARIKFFMSTSSSFRTKSRKTNDRTQHILELHRFSSPRVRRVGVLPNEHASSFLKLLEQMESKPIPPSFVGVLVDNSPVYGIEISSQLVSDLTE